MSEYKKGFLERFFRYPRLIVFVITIITVFFAFQLPRAELDNNNIRFVPEDDEARITSRYIDDTFGSSLFILVALEREYGDVFDARFLNRIREFNLRVEGFEITGEINSIVSSDYIFSEGDSIIVEKLAPDDFSGTQEEIAVLKQRLFSWDIYRRSLISDDFSSTQILIPLDITDEMASRPEVIDSFIEIRDIAKEMFKGYAEVYVTGLPLISAVVNESMRSDLKTMIPLVVLVVLLVLFFSFRSFTPVILPLVTVLVAVVWSMGAMPLVGIKLSVVSSVLPVILVAVGSAYGIHVMTHYLEEMENRDGIGCEEHRLLVLAVLKKIGKAVFLAAVTTLAGFCSFCFTSVLPIREFGFFSTFGVLVSFLASVTLIPALLILRGPRRISNPAARSDTINESAAINKPSIQINRADKSIARFFVGIARKKPAVIFTAALIVGVSILGISKVVVDNVFVEYFKTTTDISRSDRFIREKFGGSKIVSVVVRADSTETILMPETLGALDDLSSYLEDRVSEVGKVMGFTDLVKRMNQVFNADKSPRGLPPKPLYVEDDDSFGFGDFGFGDFESNPDEFGFFDEGSSGDSSDLAAALDTAGSVSPDASSDGMDFSSAGENNPISAAEIIRLLKEAASAGKDRSIDSGDLVREMEKLINYEGASYYEIPRDLERYGETRPEELSRLVGNYLLLLSGNISSYANDPLSPTAIKNTVQLRTLGDEDTGRAIASMRRFITDNFPKNVTTVIGGSALVESSLTRLVVKSQLSSVVISILVVFLIIALSNRSFIAGVIGIAPLSISILVNFAVMGFMGIKLNLGTSMVASVSVGIGIDYTIHYMEAYKREYLVTGRKGAGRRVQTGNYIDGLNGEDGAFLLKTFAASGKAIIINAVSVGSGFAVLLFSQFIMLKDLGLLITITMASSALVSLTLLPVLLLIVKPRFVQKEKA